MNEFEKQGRRRPDVHLSLTVRGMKPSSTVAINELSDDLRRLGRDVYKLGLGQSPFPVPASVVDALRENAAQKDYLPVRGLKKLREAVADYHRRTDETTSTADDILIGPGSKELMFLLQIVYYGELVIPTPAWVSYAPQAKIIGRNVHFLHTHAANGWLLEPNQLEELCQEDRTRPRIVILNYPSNPTGQTYSAKTLEEIAGVASRYGLIILSDEIYGELHHQGKHISISRFYPEGTIISSGLSKWCGAGGWRLGTFTFPSSLRWLLEAMTAVASETYTSTSAPIQHAAVRAFQGGKDLEQYLWHSRRILSSLGQDIHKRLVSAGLKVAAPEGAFYLFPDFSTLTEKLMLQGITTSRKLCEKLLEQTGVAILPGSDFGRRDEELTARLAYVDFDGNQALAASGLLPTHQPLDEAFLRTYCGGVLKAIDRLCRWISE